MSQSVHILDCKDSTIKITSRKINHILINRCYNTTIEFGGVISSVEVVNAQNVKVSKFST